MKLAGRMIRDERGQDLAEYAIALAVITIAVIAAFTIIAPNIAMPLNSLRGPCDEASCAVTGRLKIAAWIALSAARLNANPTRIRLCYR